LGFETFKLFHISDKIQTMQIMEYVDGKVTNAGKFFIKISEQNFRIVLRKMIKNFPYTKCLLKLHFSHHLVHVHSKHYTSDLSELYVTAYH